MNTSIIFAHPSLKSFNYAIAETCLDILKQRGYKLFFHDLYREKFDPLHYTEGYDNISLIPSDIKIYCDEIIQSKGIIIIHPNWWGQPPAIMKGWIDRVFRPGLAFKFLEGDKGNGIPVGLLKDKTALVFNTSNTPVEREKNVFGDPLETIWKNCIFGLCGVKEFQREVFDVVVTSTVQQRKEWLKKVEYLVEKNFPDLEHDRV